MTERLTRAGTPLLERARWTAYGLVAGLLLGLVLGWFFHRVVGLILWIFFIALILTPFILAVIFWRRVNRPKPSGEIVAEADWRDLDGSRRR